jgi:hypothetical protein
MKLNLAIIPLLPSIKWLESLKNGFNKAILNNFCQG